jgi:hypothetical protein
MVPHLMDSLAIDALGVVAEAVALIGPWQCYPATDKHASAILRAGRWREARIVPELLFIAQASDAEFSETLQQSLDHLVDRTRDWRDIGALAVALELAAIHGIECAPYARQLRGLVGQPPSISCENEAAFLRALRSVGLREIHSAILNDLSRTRQVLSIPTPMQRELLMHAYLFEQWEWIRTLVDGMIIANGRGYVPFDVRTLRPHEVAVFRHIGARYWPELEQAL